MPTIEEITVTGKRDPFSWDWGLSEEWDREEEGREEYEEAEEARREAAEEAEEAFLPPPVVPVIEEIIATAPRQTVTTTASRLAGFNLAGLGAWVGGMILAEGLREVSQARLDEAGRLAVAPVPPKPDTPLRTIQPEVIPEVIVTAQRQYERPPMPQFFDRDFDPDPWFLETVYPRVMPTTPTITTPVDIPAPQPVTAPAPAPATMPQPLTIPQFTPFAEPTVSPATRPATAPAPAIGPGLMPSLQPFVSPAPAPGLAPGTVPGVTALPGLMPGTQVRPGTSTQPRTGLFASMCPTPAQVRAKCKKEKNKPRRRCYRKLVKERRLPSMDEIYNWAEIDCDTGRELRK